MLGPSLGKNVLLEAELAIRELLRMGAPSLRGDGALRKGSFSGLSEVAATTQADDLFRLLREWVMEISGLGGVYSLHLNVFRYLWLTAGTSMQRLAPLPAQ